jgi:hypothetical protein
MTTDKDVIIPIDTNGNFMTFDFWFFGNVGDLKIDEDIMRTGDF